jgi:hypothetical protein
MVGGEQACARPPPKLVEGKHTPNAPAFSHGLNVVQRVQENEPFPLGFNEDSA